MVGALGADEAGALFGRKDQGSAEACPPIKKARLAPRFSKLSFL
jgi:hypothetical protein